jgi:hypothetical protein
MTYSEMLEAYDKEGKGELRETESPPLTEQRVREIVREEIDKYSVAVHGLTGILRRDKP